MKTSFTGMCRLILLFAALFSVGCTEKEPEPIAVTSVTLNTTSLELTEGDTASLTATVSPSNADNQKLIWISGNMSVATVKEGVVTAINSGKTEITVKTDDGGKTATCTVIVTDRIYSVESVSLNKTSLELIEGDDVTLTVTINPDNATNKDIVWSSSDESVVNVVDGKVTALKVGAATVTVKTVDGDKTASCKITVLPRAVESVNLDYSHIQMKRGEEFILTATINPDNATNKNITWSSSDENIITVVDGKVTAVNAGQATITVKTEDGEKTATCDVTVIVPVTGVAIEKSEVSMKLGTSASLSAVVQPIDATDKSLKWSINNTAVATISDNIVTAVGLGTAVVTVTTVDGGFTAETKITVISGDVNPDGSDMDIIKDEF